MERRLAAIVAADVVGYSRLIRADEDGTLAAIKALREQIVDPSIATNHGRIVKLMGDGMLIEFSSVVDAVRSSVEIQQAIAARTDETPEDQRIVFRVGINSGDVVIDGDDIHGDGVNVAARLEALAEPGGINLSAAVHDQVRDRLDYAFEDLGEQELKNIDRPVRVWRWVCGSVPAGPAASAAPASPEIPDKPSVAVLPFDNMSGDADQDFFADGLAEDIITTLSKVSGLFVIARNSSFAYKGKAIDIRVAARELGVRYVLEGSVRKGGNRLRITAQLIEAETGNHVWAERYDRVMEDIFEVQDEITKEIVTALRVQLTEGETAAIVAKGTKNIDAWANGVQASRLLDRFGADDTIQARTLAEKALALDPDYGFGWTILGVSYWYEARITLAGDLPALITKARDAIEKSLALDPNDPIARGMLGLIFLSEGGFDDAIATGEANISVNPGSADARAFYAFALIHAGRWKEGITAFAEATRLNPHHPLWYFPVLARGHDAIGEFDEALALLKTAIQREGANFPASLHMASLYARTGQAEAAGRAAADVLHLVPKFTTSLARNWLLMKEGAFLDAYLDGLRKAGIPD